MEGRAQGVGLTDVLIDEATWQNATRSRRAEWVQAIAELQEEAAFFVEADPQTALTLDAQDGQPLPKTLHGRICVTPERLSLVLHDPNGTQVGRMDLPRLLLLPVLRQYMQLLKVLEASDFAEVSQELEAVDIARRLAHDDAAALLTKSCVGVRPDHQTARRLFTLVVLLTHDTTQQSLAWAWPS